VHVAPDETDTLASIPRGLLFPAPGMPPGHMVMGYDERGHCPMLTDDRCSIYEHRPRTCRAFDCRVFAATEVEPDEDKVFITDRVRRWRFTFEGDDVVTHHAICAAARAVESNRSALPARAQPHGALQLAVAAIELHELFLRHDPETGHRELVEPTDDVIVSALTGRVDDRPRHT
jgi:Fe-S-cluster containining protein